MSPFPSFQHWRKTFYKYLFFTPTYETNRSFYFSLSYEHTQHPSLYLSLSPSLSLSLSLSFFLSISLSLFFSPTPFSVLWTMPGQKNLQLEHCKHFLEFKIMIIHISKVFNYSLSDFAFCYRNSFTYCSVFHYNFCDVDQFVSKLFFLKWEECAKILWMRSNILFPHSCLLGWTDNVVAREWTTTTTTSTST
jgi:hypothetical protein